MADTQGSQSGQSGQRQPGQQGQGAASQRSQNSSQSSDELQAEVQSLKSDLHKIQSDLREMTDTVWSMGRTSYERASDTMHSRVEQSMEQVQDYMQRQPISTVIMAFVAGIIFGKIFIRR